MSATLDLDMPTVDEAPAKDPTHCHLQTVEDRDGRVAWELGRPLCGSQSGTPCHRERDDDGDPLPPRPYTGRRRCPDCGRPICPACVAHGPGMSA